MGTVDQDAERLGLTARRASHDLDQDTWLVELARWDMVEVLRRDAGPLGEPTLQPVRLQPLRRARAVGDQCSGPCGDGRKWRRSQASCLQARVKASWSGQAGMKSLKQPWQRTYMSVCQSQVGVVHGP